nr:toprim domain-containing protein [Acuticoccus kalidii]
MLCRVDGPAGELLGVWRIYITKEGQKAFGGESKLGLGPVKGGAVRLGPPAAGKIGLAEGVETALSVMCLSGGRIPVWAALSTSGMMTFEPPFEVGRIHIYPDYDVARRRRATDEWRPSPGVLAAFDLKARMDEQGIACLIDPSRPRRGADYNDVLRRVSRMARA